MFGWIGSLFSSQKSVDTMVEGAVNGLDKLWFTDEEKSEAELETKKEASSALLSWIGATSGSNKARRLIAFTVTGIWSLNYSIAMVMDAVSPFLTNEVVVKAMAASSLSLQTSGETINGAMMLVLAFYFAGNHIGKIVDVAMTKFSGNKNK